MLTINFWSYYELTVNNTSYKMNCKYTFENIKWIKSINNYILKNRNIHPPNVLDKRTLNSAKTNVDQTYTRITENEDINVKRAKLFWNETTKKLYPTKLKKKENRSCKCRSNIH